MNSKLSLRRSLRQARRSLSRAQQRQAALRLCRRLLGNRWFKRSRRIGIYWPADGEISPLPLLPPAARSGKTLYLPVIRGRSLVFRRYQPGDRLRGNRFGIPEPAPRQPLRLARQLDLILVPLVGFDPRCHRLGMGAGFYDRCFARAGARPRRIGLAHELQKVALVPQDPWDKPLHAVMTDRAIYQRGRRDSTARPGN